MAFSLKILGIALKVLLFVGSFFYFGVAHVVAQLVACSLELGLQLFQFIVLALQLIILSAEPRLQPFEFFLAFIGGRNRVLNADDADFGRGWRGGRSLRHGCAGEKGAQTEAEAENQFLRLAKHGIAYSLKLILPRNSSLPVSQPTTGPS